MPASSPECVDSDLGPRTSFSRPGTAALGSASLAFGGLDVLWRVGGVCVLAPCLSSSPRIAAARQAQVGACGERPLCKLTRTQFAIILTITCDVVTRFQMLEDSLDVSNAARV